jgi:hypothetical protein
METLEAFQERNRYGYKRRQFMGTPEDDYAIVVARMAEVDKILGPRIGDFVIMLDGSLHRLTYDWVDYIQTAPAGSGSYYLSNLGASYSGALCDPLPAPRIEPTDGKMEGDVWIFSHDHARAYNGVHIRVDFRVYKVV